MRPHVFRGLWCRCGERHHQAASYYVSVADGSRVVLAAGPYPEHSDALAMVDTVRELVMARYNPGGRAHWYSYGTTAMRAGYDTTGSLMGELVSWPGFPEPTKAPRVKRTQLQTTEARR